MAPAKEGRYTKLSLAVEARTEPGQVVLVSDTASSSRAEDALELVTSPKEWPMW